MISAESIPATALYVANAFSTDSNPAFKQMVSDADQGENTWPYPVEGQCMFFEDNTYSDDHIEIHFDTNKCGPSPYSFEIGS